MQPNSCSPVHTDNPASWLLSKRNSQHFTDFILSTYTSVRPTSCQVALCVMASTSIIGEVRRSSRHVPCSRDQHLIVVFLRHTYPFCTAPYQPTPGDIYTRLLLPSARICIVIGRGGEAIRGICDITGAHVNIASPGANHRDPTHRLVRPSI